MKNTNNSIKTLSRHSENILVDSDKKITNINILLNRVKSNKKDEHKKKFYFSAITSVGLILFGLVVFY